MGKPSINDVLARNLAYFMEKQGLTQTALAKRSGVKQNTISIYLDPSKRKPGVRGKEASAKLTEVAMLAEGLKIEPWELIRNLSQKERDAYTQIESAFRAIRRDQEPRPKAIEQTKLAA